MSLRKLLPYLILLAAFGMRTWQLTAVPPGFTHDEAAHGHDAAYILKGVRLIYFTIGYGREPLFDYLNAGLIAGMGANGFTLRFSAVIWSLITLAATYKAARLAFGRRTAWLTMAFMAASFWPLETSRQILRSDLLPAELALATICFLNLGKAQGRRLWLWALGLALCIAASLYTYIPARVLWAIFPLTLLLAAVYRRLWPSLSIAPPRWVATILAIALAFGLAAPLFIYLNQHPDAEQRIGMLSQPITALQSGDPSALINNAREFLLAFFWPGHGDSFLAYTLPGRPIYDPLSFILTLLGLLVLIWAMVAPALKARLLNQISPPPSPVSATLFLLWLGLGLAPSVVTGPEALTTRIIGAQPVLYVLPALGLAYVLTLVEGRIKTPATKRGKTQAGQGVAWVSGLVVAGFVGVLAILSSYDYFVTWANLPYLRAAYQSTLVAMLTDLHEPTVISTLNPSDVHDPYIGELLTTAETRWVDARYAVILRFSNASPLQLLVPNSTPLHPFFQPFFQQRIKVKLLPTDLDPDYILYQPRPFNETTTGQLGPQFNGAIEVRSMQWLAASYKPGDVAELFMGWKVIDASRLGEIHPPAFKTELTLFTHILNADGSVFAQRDHLDAPSWDWQTGDTVLQIHQFAIPAEAKAGQYSVEIGFYDEVTGDRLPVTGSEATSIAAPDLIIQP